MHSVRRFLPIAFVCALLAGSATPAAAETKSSDAQYAVDTAHSQLDISGRDSVLGNHTLTFDRWSARIDTRTIPARLVFEIDLASIRSNESMVKSIVANHML